MSGLAAATPAPVVDVPEAELRERIQRALPDHLSLLEASTPGARLRFGQWFVWDLRRNVAWRERVDIEQLARELEGR